LGAAALIAGVAFYGGQRAALQSPQGGTAPASARTTTAPTTAAPTATASGKSATAATNVQRTLTSAASHGSASTASLPPPGTSLKQTFAELKARADAGDAAAASRLFHDIETCSSVQHLNRMMPFIANRLSNINAAPAGEGQRGNGMLGMMQRGLDFADQNAALCADLSDEQMAALVPATLQAAQLGDPQAADCYVGANLNTWPDVLNNPGWVSDYKSNAMPLATAAVQQGDWSMVGLLASAYAGGVRNNNLLHQVTGSDATLAYSYAKLMSLGQPANNTSNRGSANLNTLASQLTPDQLQSSDAWAQNMYKQYFNATPRDPGQVTNTMRNCQAMGPGF
jgi:hypothetical protein